MKQTLQAFLRFLGKGETRVAMVFGLDPESCLREVRHIRNGAPGVPILVFSHDEPWPETRSLCQAVHVNHHSLVLLGLAARQLWPCWVAIGVTAWTGTPGKWILKLAPFLIPPFHALVLNESGDFFAGRPVFILRHLSHRLRDALGSGEQRVRGLGHGLGDAMRSGEQRVRDLARAYRRLMALVALRLVSRVCGVLFHWRRRPLFQYMNPGESLSVPPTATDGRSVLRFCQAGSQWSGSIVDQTLRQSHASLLLWQEEGQAKEEIEDLLPFFDDERTFAVSRQSHFRGWKPLLFPTAPFRALQPEEASQVLAPLSPGILVDRRKLLALGVPNCSLAGTAWMILFWKAAAAGWRSYSVGQSGAVFEQPDLPMQETGFRNHLVFNSASRRLGPREPDLSRGNIAFALAARPCAPQPERLKVLLVSPYLPYPLSHGGAVRIFNLCRALSHRVDFVLVAVREQNDVVRYDKLREVFREIYIVDRDERPSEDESLPEQVRQYESRSLRALVAELARTWKPDLLQIEYTHLARLRDAAPEIPALLVEHDLTFGLYRQLAENRKNDPQAWREYQRWFDFERHWLAAYDGVWMVSDEDRKTAVREGKRPPDRTFCIPNGVDIDRFLPRDEPAPAPAPEILFVGSFRHLPNVIGFQNLRDQVLPRIWLRYPGARCCVVAGPQHQAFWSRFSQDGTSPAFDNRVEVHGFVEDLRPLYARASVVVVPLEVSAGTNIKVLEAMACGKAVVTTAIGCAGLGLVDGRDVFIGRDWVHFAERIGELLSDDALRLRMGQVARRTAEERFGWDAIAASAYASYQALNEAGRRDRESRFDTLGPTRLEPVSADQLQPAPSAGSWRTDVLGLPAGQSATPGSTTSGPAAP